MTPQRRRQDLSTIALIGVAHGTSHFFHMLLPPLFPVFIRDFGLTYAELGLLVKNALDALELPVFNLAEYSPPAVLERLRQRWHTSRPTHPPAH